EDADWIRNNIEAIAANLVYSLTEYFGIPFNTPQNIFTASVATQGSNLNIRNSPSMTGQIIGRIPNGAEVTVYSINGDWAVVTYNGVTGYVSRRYLQY
ncbi:MAG: SH3 domain-containing protein, partial [Clostridia bacterium]|nr:SH3 domain-containing protein [Clostridia bacterium]